MQNVRIHKAAISDVESCSFGGAPGFCNTEGCDTTVKRGLEQGHVLHVYGVAIRHCIMGYITRTAQITSLLIANVFQVFTITTRFQHEVPSSKNFRRQIDTLPFPDWELGLREAVYQSLLRERNLHPNLREYLYSAPILGRQDTATPFGDIAILARGQLYSAPGGFQFVQDPYQNDCDECHNPPPRCDRTPCENWRPQGHERLLALWTVKRIRHRDPNYGFRYELDFKVSPMNVPANEPFVTRSGRFDYSVPGHTFIIKAKNPREYDPSYQSVNPRPDKIYRSSNSYDSNKWSPNFGPNFDARYLPPLPVPPPPVVQEYYDEDPRNAGHPNVLYGPPELYTKTKPYTRYTTKRPQAYDDKDAERELFKSLLETLSSKTSTTGQTPLSTAGTITSSELPSRSQTPEYIFTPLMTTKSSPQPTALTTSQLSTKTTSRDGSYHPTSVQAPLLPTMSIPSLFDTTVIFPLTMDKEDVTPTKPLFTPSTVRFPTPITSMSTKPLFTSHKTQTTPTTNISKSTHFVKYSEPDPLYHSSVTPTQQMIISKAYPMRTTKRFKPTRKYKTTENDDYDIFGVKEETPATETYSKKFNGMKFPGVVNVKLPPGEQVIKVVNAPTIVPKGDERHEITNPTTKHEGTLPNTEHSQPSKSTPKYQVDFNNTQLLQPTGESFITIGLSPSTRGQQSSSTTLSTQSSSWFEFTTKTTVLQETVQQSSAEPVTASTNSNAKLTTEYTTLSTESSVGYEHTVAAIPSMKTTTSKVTSTATYETVPFTNTTEKITRTTLPSTVETSSTHTMSTSTTATHLSISPTSSSTSITVKLTTATSPITQTSSPISKTTSLLTYTTWPSQKTVMSKQRPLPTKPMTRRYKPLTQPTKTTVGEEKAYVSRSDITHVPVTDSTIASTVYSKSSETTMIPTTPIKVLDYTTYPTVVTTNMDIFSTPSSDAPRTTTYGLPKLSRKPIRLPTKRTKPTLLTTYTTPLSTTTIITTEPPTPISRTSEKDTYSSTWSTTQMIKIPSQTTSSTTQTFVDNFLIEKKDKIGSKKPKVTLQDEDFDLDIFGMPQEKVISEPYDSKMQHKQSFNSKEIDDIFGIQPAKKQPVRDDYDYDYDNIKLPTSTTNKVKIIYSDFYSPSTATSAEKSITKTDFKEVVEEAVETTTVMEVNNSSEELKNKTTESQPLTSQSYSTSVSIEINKRNESTTEADFLGVNSENESISEEVLLKKAEPKATTCNTTEKNEEQEKNKILDALALSVVNHAKSLDYLNSSNNSSNNDDNSNNTNSINNNHKNNNSVTEQKYKRKRTYRVQKLRRRN